MSEACVGLIACDPLPIVDLRDLPLAFALDSVSFGCLTRVSCAVALCAEMKQKYVESALPKAGGQVLVVQGKHKGQTGTLLERNGKTAQALVQLDSDMNSVVFGFDDVAEHVPEAGK